MDLPTVTGYRSARTPADLALEPGERFLAGGTWLFSDPHPDVTGLVDLTTMGWTALEESAAGLRVAATCTIAELAAYRGAWRAQPLFLQSASALLASFKVWNVATVGGNICRGFAAAAMTSLCTALDGVAEVWMPGGDAYRVPVAELATGNGTTALRPGEVLRAVDLPAAALRARTALRRIALAERGRSGAVVIGRLDEDGAAVFSITAATERPGILRYDRLPDAGALRADVHALPGYYTDPLGAADWRRHVSAELADEIRAELAA
ncbi:MAG: FAD binding domain-containing protein [Microbacterium sp.]|uniref:FAD binding domain-containing protein n=1 Tax=Microbacterium sp. TaxID=51671 RepID=UPI001AD2436E|nr:FAD binding domain-containing protein [Microbacterium sp.]MBN9176761.1 FAD binding domain-containing protein [Microbacterium sp.]